MIAILALIVIDIYILLNTGKKNLEKTKKVGDKKVEWTVYGTSWCGWTTKQLEYLKRKIYLTNSSIAKKAIAMELKHFQL